MRVAAVLLLLNSSILLANNSYIEPISKNPPKNLSYLISWIKNMDIKTDDVYSSEIAPSLRSYASFENLLEGKKVYLDNNKTWQRKKRALGIEFDYFCDKFYDDLLNLENILVHKPVVSHTSYDNEIFQKYMGNCLSMFHYAQQNQLIEDSPDSYSLYDNINIGYGSQIFIIEHKNSDTVVTYEKDYCDKFKDKANLYYGPTRYNDEYYVNTDNSLQNLYFAVIKYKNEDYILQISKPDIAMKNYDVTYVEIKNDIPVGWRWNMGDVCSRTYFKKR